MLRRPASMSGIHNAKRPVYKTKQWLQKYPFLFLFVVILLLFSIAEITCFAASDTNKDLTIVLNSDIVVPAGPQNLTLTISNYAEGFLQTGFVLPVAFRIMLDDIPPSVNVNSAIKEDWYMNLGPVHAARYLASNETDLATHQPCACYYKTTTPKLSSTSDHRVGVAFAPNPNAKTDAMYSQRFTAFRFDFQRNDEIYEYLLTNDLPPIQIECTHLEVSPLQPYKLRAPSITLRRAGKLPISAEAYILEQPSQIDFQNESKMIQTAGGPPTIFRNIGFAKPINMTTTTTYFGYNTTTHLYTHQVEIQSSHPGSFYLAMPYSRQIDVYGTTVHFWMTNIANRAGTKMLAQTGGIRFGTNGSSISTTGIVKCNATTTPKFKEPNNTPILQLSEYSQYYNWASFDLSIYDVSEPLVFTFSSYDPPTSYFGFISTDQAGAILDARQSPNCPYFETEQVLVLFTAYDDFTNTTRITPTLTRDAPFSEGYEGLRDDIPLLLLPSPNSDDNVINNKPFIVGLSSTYTDSFRSKVKQEDHVSAPLIATTRISLQINQFDQHRITLTQNLNWTDKLRVEVYYRNPHNVDELLPFTVKKFNFTLFEQTVKYTNSITLQYEQDEEKPTIISMVGITRPVFTTYTTTVIPGSSMSLSPYFFLPIFDNRLEYFIKIVDFHYVDLIDPSITYHTIGGDKFLIPQQDKVLQKTISLPHGLGRAYLDPYITPKLITTTMTPVIANEIDPMANTTSLYAQNFELKTSNFTSGGAVKWINDDDDNNTTSFTSQDAMLDGTIGGFKLLYHPSGFVFPETVTNPKHSVCTIYLTPFILQRTTDIQQPDVILTQRVTFKAVDFTLNDPSILSAFPPYQQQQSSGNIGETIQNDIYYLDIPTFQYNSTWSKVQLIARCHIDGIAGQIAAYNLYENIAQNRYQTFFLYDDLITKNFLEGRQVLLVQKNTGSKYLNPWVTKHWPEDRYNGGSSNIPLYLQLRGVLSLTKNVELKMIEILYKALFKIDLILTYITLEDMVVNQGFPFDSTNSTQQLELIEYANQNLVTFDTFKQNVKVQLIYSSYDTDRIDTRARYVYYPNQDGLDKPYVETGRAPTVFTTLGFAIFGLPGAMGKLWNIPNAGNGGPTDNWIINGLYVQHLWNYGYIENVNFYKTIENEINNIRTLSFEDYYNDNSNNNGDEEKEEKNNNNDYLPFINKKQQEKEKYSILQLLFSQVRFEPDFDVVRLYSDLLGPLTGQGTLINTLLTSPVNVPFSCLTREVGTCGYNTLGQIYKDKKTYYFNLAQEEEENNINNNQFTKKHENEIYQQIFNDPSLPPPCPITCSPIYNITSLTSSIEQSCDTTFDCPTMIGIYDFPQARCESTSKRCFFNDTALQTSWGDWFSTVNTPAVINFRYPGTVVINETNNNSIVDATAEYNYQQEQLNKQLTDGSCGINSTLSGYYCFNYPTIYNIQIKSTTAKKLNQNQISLQQQPQQLQNDNDNNDYYYITADDIIKLHWNYTKPINNHNQQEQQNDDDNEKQTRLTIQLIIKDTINNTNILYKQSLITTTLSQQTVDIVIPQGVPEFDMNIVHVELNFIIYATNNYFNEQQELYQTIRLNPKITKKTTTSDDDNDNTIINPYYTPFVLLTSCKSIQPSSSSSFIINNRCMNNGQCSISTGLCKCNNHDEYTFEDYCTTSRCYSVLNCNVDNTKSCTFTSLSSSTTANDANNNNNIITNLGQCICKDGFQGDLCNDIVPPPPAPTELTQEQCLAKLRCIKQNTAYAQCSNNDNQKDQCVCSNQFWGSSRCEKCYLQCINGGKVNTRCTGCTCPAGRSGLICECLTRSISLSFTNTPRYIDIVLDYVKDKPKVLLSSENNVGISVDSWLASKNAPLQLINESVLLRSISPSTTTSSSIVKSNVKQYTNTELLEAFDKTQAFLQNALFSLLSDKIVSPTTNVRIAGINRLSDVDFSVQTILSDCDANNIQDQFKIQELMTLQKTTPVMNTMSIFNTNEENEEGQINNNNKVVELFNYYTQKQQDINYLREMQEKDEKMNKTFQQFKTALYEQKVTGFFSYVQHTLPDNIQLLGVSDLKDYVQPNIDENDNNDNQNNSAMHTHFTLTTCKTTVVMLIIACITIAFGIF